MFVLGRKVSNIKHGTENSVFPLITHPLILLQQNRESGNMSDFSMIKFHHTCQSVYQGAIEHWTLRKKERKKERKGEKKKTVESGKQIIYGRCDGGLMESESKYVYRV